MARVYISSTYQDLIEYREAVYRALRELRHHVLAMKDYTARDERPQKRCPTDVGASDPYARIFAGRYGYVPNDKELAGEQESIMCWNTAMRGRKTYRCRCFTK